jgi:hypothetical protein
MDCYGMTCGAAVRGARQSRVIAGNLHLDAEGREA